MADADEPLDVCIARLNGEYRCVLRPNGSARWVQWIKPAALGWMPVTERQVVQALRGAARESDLMGVVSALQRDPRIAIETGQPLPELTEDQDGFTYL